MSSVQPALGDRTDSQEREARTFRQRSRRRGRRGTSTRPASQPAAQAAGEAFAAYDETLLDGANNDRDRGTRRVPKETAGVRRKKICIFCKEHATGSTTRM